MTKPEVVDWLLKNGFVCKEKRKIHFYRTYADAVFYFDTKVGNLVWKDVKVEEYVNIWNGSVWVSLTGEKYDFTESGLDCVHIDEDGWLILENVWELKPWEEIQ